MNTPQRASDISLIAGIAGEVRGLTDAEEDMIFGDKIDALLPKRQNASADAASRKIGTRIIGTRMGTFDNTTPGTWQDAIGLPAHAIAFQLLYANGSTTQTTHIAKAFVCSQDTSPSNTITSAAQATFTSAGVTANDATIPVTTQIQEPSIIASDWIGLDTVDRTDGGNGIMVVVRTYIDTAATISVRGNGGNDNYIPWVTEPNGLVWISRRATGDATASFGSGTTNLSQTPLIGIRYVLRSGQVITLGAIGDSITQGAGDTYIGGGWLRRAALLLSAANPGVVYEFANLGYSGGDPARFAKRLSNFLTAGVRPTVLFSANGSPNGVQTPITAANISGLRRAFGKVKAEASTRGIPLLVWTMLPVNTSIYAWAASDSLRRAYNDETRAGVTKGDIVIDFGAKLSGVDDGTGQIQMAAGKHADSIHPNSSGDDDLALLAVEAVKKSVTIYTAGALIS